MMETPAKTKAELGIDDSKRELEHRVYDAALDNSLWPEMIVSIVDHVNYLEAMPPEVRDRVAIKSINDHFNRAFAISNKIVRLQEANQEKGQVLATLSCDITLLDVEGAIFFNNHIHWPSDRLGMEGQENKPLTLQNTEMTRRLSECKMQGVPQVWTQTGTEDRAFVMLPRDEARSLGFPERAETVIVAYALDASRVIDGFASRYGLSPSLARLLKPFVRTSDLRHAAGQVGITYESARKYLKTIYAKTGVTSQSQLMRAILFDPSMLFSDTPDSPSLPLPVRRMMTVSKGRTIEYFSLGPEDGYPVLFFDALAGSAIDVVGHPERYLPRLNELGMRLISPCRPGGFRSTYRPLESLCDLAEDATALCDELGFKKVSLLSYSYGSNAALAIAHQLPDLVERITMSSVSYMTYSHENWREMDLFFQVSNVIGKRWPNLLKRLIPFLARSIMQNVHSFADRSAKHAKCDHDRAILLDHSIRERTRAMLMERTARGMDGVVEEFRINAKPYDFDVCSIAQPMTLLHGEFDVNNPLGGAVLLADHAPNADLHVLPGMGHHHLFIEWDWILAAAIGMPFTVPDPTRRP